MPDALADGFHLTLAECGTKWGVRGLMVAAGHCGCNGDLSVAPALVLGRQQTNWGSEVCLPPTDMRVTGFPRGYGNVHFRFVEANTNLALAAGPVEAGFRHRVLWDGELLSTSEARPELGLNVERPVFWAGGLVLPRDEGTHTLRLELNTPTLGTTIPEVNAANNAYELTVRSLPNRLPPRAEAPQPPHPRGCPPLHPLRPPPSAG